MITIKEIANQLGVSPTTVSNVINGRTEKMSAKTRERIEEALIKNHYVQEVKSVEMEQDLRLIAVDFFLGEKENVIVDSFCGELLGAIEKHLRPYKRHVVYDSSSKEEELLQKFNARNVEGGILLGYDPSRCESLQKRCRKPIVFIDSGNGNYDNIGLQDFEGAYEMVSYLIDQGHRKIAFFGDYRKEFGSSYERYLGMKKAMKDYELEFTAEDCYYLSFQQNKRYEVMRQFAKREANEKEKKGYTAIFFVSDYFASESIGIFYRQGLHIPNDISIVGFDDNIYARLAHPMLTTIRQSPTEKGKEAVDLLMKRIYGEEVAVRSMELPTELIVRDSVKNLREQR